MPSVPWIPKFAKQLLDIKALLTGNRGKALVINEAENGIDVIAIDGVGSIDGGGAGTFLPVEYELQLDGGYSNDQDKGIISGGSSSNTVNNIIIDGGAS